MHWLLLGVVLLLFCLVGVTDWKTRIIPNNMVLGILVCGILDVFATKEVSILSRGIGLFVISIPLCIVSVLMGKAFGGGDIKLMGAAGVFLGAPHVVVGFVFGVFLAGFYSIYLILYRGKQKNIEIPFGPFLCIGLGMAIFGGTEFIQWFIGGT